MGCEEGSKNRLLKQFAKVGGPELITGVYGQRPVGAPLVSRNREIAMTSPIVITSRLFVKDGDGNIGDDNLVEAILAGWETLALGQVKPAPSLCTAKRNV